MCFQQQIVVGILVYWRTLLFIFDIGPHFSFKMIVLPIKKRKKKEKENNFACFLKKYFI